MVILSNRRINKVRFYAKAVAQHALVPTVWFRMQLTRKLARLDRYDPEQILDRVNYYNKLVAPFKISDDASDLKSIPSTKKTAYYYDMRAMLRNFPASCRGDYAFGDIRDTAAIPTLVKSRAIEAGNNNNVLLKLNQVRHFPVIKDRIPFEQKKDLLVWRGAGWQPHRKTFLSNYWNHPLCDVGQVNDSEEGTPEGWNKEKMTIDEQLHFKFILSIEGNDVATNLKWIAQSNSLCFMTKPKFETWMMEGRLISGTHYVELRSDYADLPQKIEYYRENPGEALAMIRNFQNYYQVFKNTEMEQLIGLMVMEKYLRLSGQL